MRQEEIDNWLSEVDIEEQSCGRCGSAYLFLQTAPVPGVRANYCPACGSKFTHRSDADGNVMQIKEVLQ